MQFLLIADRGPKLAETGYHTTIAYSDYLELISVFIKQSFVLVACVSLSLTKDAPGYNRSVLAVRCSWSYFIGQKRIFIAKFSQFHKNSSSIAGHRQDHFRLVKAYSLSIGWHLQDRLRK